MRRLTFIGALIIATTIASLAAYSRHGRTSSRCALDGSLIEPPYEVTIIDKDGSESSFSCVLSAQIWLEENSDQAFSIQVTDEITGEKIAAADAYYVASELVTIPHTGNRVHVFARKAAAELHARQFNGKLVKKPFRTHRKKTVKLATYLPDAPNRTGFLPSSPQKPLCFAGDTVLVRGPDYCCLYQDHLNRLSKGYSSPPDKPPRHFF
jgi:hypothetical protein